VGVARVRETATSTLQVGMDQHDIGYRSCRGLVAIGRPTCSSRTPMWTRRLAPRSLWSDRILRGVDTVESPQSRRAFVSAPTWQHVRLVNADGALPAPRRSFLPRRPAATTSPSTPTATWAGPRARRARLLDHSPTNERRAPTFPPHDRSASLGWPTARTSSTVSGGGGPEPQRVGARPLRTWVCSSSAARGVPTKRQIPDTRTPLFSVWVLIHETVS